MESTLVMSCGACVSFMVYYALVDQTYIESLSSHGAIFALRWDFKESHCFTAIVIGIVSAGLGIVIMLGIGITKQILNRIRMRLQHNKLLSLLVPSILSGLAIGVVNYALPLTIGNGNQVVSPMISYAVQNKLSTSLLVSSGFGKAFTLGMSMNGGFVGGFVFPLITIGAMAGLVCSQLYPSLPLGLCLGCFIGGLPASICPMPFTLACLAIFIFYFGLYQTFPIFLSCIVSYTLVVGSGLFGALQRRATAAERTASPSTEKAVKEKTIAEARLQESKRAEEQFAFEQYYLAKNGHAMRSTA
jgi:H+/Cl- antiporter ClcA